MKIFVFIKNKVIYSTFQKFGVGTIFVCYADQNTVKH